MKHQTRMHSSRMRTVHCSGRPGGGVRLPRGMSQHALGTGGCLPQCMLGYRSPPVNRITDACENIILPLIKCIFGDIIFAPCVPAPYPLLTLACCTCYLEHFLFSIESSLVSFVALVSNYEFRTINDMYFNL